MGYLSVCIIVEPVCEMTVEKVEVTDDRVEITLNMSDNIEYITCLLNPPETEENTSIEC